MEAAVRKASTSAISGNGGAIAIIRVDFQLLPDYNDLFDDAQIEGMTPDFAAEIAEEITAIIAKHSRVDWTNNQTIHNRISQDIDDLFYAYEKNRGLVLSFDLIDKVIENVKTVALRRF